jgi:molybdopterin/thiamine biosynthesis adenylyltransferase
VILEESVLLVGAGGLGCGAALVLAAAGLRHLTVVDDDIVEESNLHRQVLHKHATIDTPKVRSLAATLAQRYPSVEVTPIQTRFEATSAAHLLQGCAVLVDGSDNLGTKFLCNDAAVLARIPLVHAAAVGLWGQLLTVAAGGRPCYRCLFEDLPPADAGVGPSCAEAGVLGPVPGVLGALQGHEAMALLRGVPAFVGRLLQYDAGALTMRSVSLRPNPHCAVCGPRPTISRLDPSAYGMQGCSP